MLHSETLLKTKLKATQPQMLRKSGNQFICLMSFEQCFPALSVIGLAQVLQYQRNGSVACHLPRVGTKPLGCASFNMFSAVET